MWPVASRFSRAISAALQTSRLKATLTRPQSRCPARARAAADQAASTASDQGGGEKTPPGFAAYPSGLAQMLWTSSAIRMSFPVIWIGGGAAT